MIHTKGRQGKGGSYCRRRKRTVKVPKRARPRKNTRKGVRKKKSRHRPRQQGGTHTHMMSSLPILSMGVIGWKNIDTTTFYLLYVIRENTDGTFVKQYAFVRWSQVVTLEKALKTPLASIKLPKKWLPSKNDTKRLNKRSGQLDTFFRGISDVVNRGSVDVWSQIEAFRIFCPEIFSFPDGYNGTTGGCFDLPNGWETGFTTTSTTCPFYPETRKNVILKTSPTGYKFCEYRGQQYYIGGGEYIPGSNRNSWCYQSIFLPFYGFEGDGNAGRILKYQSENQISPGANDNTILTHFFGLLMSDGEREKDHLDPLYTERKGGGEKGYILKETDGQPTIFQEETSVRILRNLEEILGDSITERRAGEHGLEEGVSGTTRGNSTIRNLLKSYLNHSIRMMGTYEDGENECGGICKEYDIRDHIYWYLINSGIGLIVYNNMQNMKHMGVGASLMAWLQRYHIDNDYQ